MPNSAIKSFRRNQSKRNTKDLEQARLRDSAQRRQFTAGNLVPVQAEQIWSGIAGRRVGDGGHCAGAASRQRPGRQARRYWRFCSGRRGAGAGPAAAWGTILRVILLAASLISSRVRRLSSITVAER